ncbi:MAG: thiosulfate oxidation carrier protein SoxY [Betaproteobacteria bacterium RBG_16_56_24]|nr:MAG: thiosulfate oxidation carrier protein SoxY [Betaproteobacteria bacterium RBG_16_56_24]
MNQLRRSFLKNAGTAGTVAAAIVAGLLKPGAVLAAAWNSLAFAAKDAAEAIKNAGYDGAAQSGDIIIKAPDIAENGAVVPVSATSNIPGTTSMVFFVEKNPTPMIASFEFSNGAEPYIATRVKMAKTSVVRVSVKAGGKSYTNSREVKVTIGGCGG